MKSDDARLNYYFIGNAELVEGIPTSTIDEAYNYLKEEKVLSLDIETTRKFGGKYPGEGLNPHLTEIVMVQIGTEDKQFIIDYRCTKLGKLLDLLVDPDIIIVGQNIKFEYLHFIHNEGIRINNVYDTMIAEQILFNGLKPESSLAALNKKYLNIEVDKTTRLEFLTIGSKPFTLRQIKYGAEDVLYPLQIRRLQIPELKQKRVWNCMKLEMKFLECLGDIEYKGMHFNKDKWLKTYEINKKKSEELKAKLDKYIVDNYGHTNFIDRQLDLFSSELKCNISWTSSKQVIKFFRYLGICPIEKSKATGKMAYTVNASVLKSSLNTINKNIDDKIKAILLLYLDFKETEQACTTFGIDFFKHVNPITGRLHSSYNQILNTGRISSRNPNLQNIPSDDSFRYCFDSPEGWKIVNADYSGQEQIILANKSQDKDLIAFYEQNLGDMHSYIASKIFPELEGKSLGDIKKYHSDKRQMAKAAGFAINYGGTGFTIAANLGVSEEIGNFVYTSYFKAFPGLNNFFSKMKKESKRQGYILIDPISGRKTWFDRNGNMHKVDKLAQNYPIQGEAGGITKYAVILMRKWILEQKLQNEVFITNIVHDEINLEVKEEYAEQAARALEDAMETAGWKWCKIVPLKADAVVTDYWTH
jgi:DNA polymerase I-like protein with 3'-5' exonuclease and polymerase domains